MGFRWTSCRLGTRSRTRRLSSLFQVLLWELWWWWWWWWLSGWFFDRLGIAADAACVSAGSAAAGAALPSACWRGSRWWLGADCWLWSFSPHLPWGWLEWASCRWGPWSAWCGPSWTLLRWSCTEWPPSHSPPCTVGSAGCSHRLLPSLCTHRDSAGASNLLQELDRAKQFGRMRNCKGLDILSLWKVTVYYQII